MKRILVLVIILSVFCSCNRTRKGPLIIIGDIADMSIGKIYIATGTQWEMPLDSATVKKGKFKINFQSNASLETLYVISYVDTSNRIRTLEFNNHILSARDSVNYVLNAFVIDVDTLLINVNKNDSRYFDLKAGKENDAFFSVQMTNIGYFEGDIVKRTIDLQKYISIIKKYPSSQYLLSLIKENRSVAHQSELNAMLKYFSEECRKTKTGSDLIKYALAKEDYPTLENFPLIDTGSATIKTINTTAKVNMLVFWASWCGPCRQEISEIKRLHDRFKNKGVDIVSISLDDSMDAWKKALVQEKMPWRQLRVPPELREEVSKKYEIGAIPYTVFVDGKGKLIDRFIGYESASIREYEIIINDKLK